VESPGTTVAGDPSVSPKPGPLDGLRVVELARFQAGPRAGLLFSDMGADVIKVEKPAPGGLKEDRASSPTFKGQSIYFAVYNRGKKSVALDLRSDDGMAVLRELIGTADFVLENYRPGTMAKMGLGYEDLRKLKSDIILISVSGFGQFGPYRERPAFDSLGQAMSGLSMLTGQSEGKPIPTASSIIDRVTGLHATIGALAALRHRDRTGEGQVVDVALLDSALTLVEVPNSYYLATGEEGGETPRPVYRASDGWVVIAANHRTLQGMIDAVGGAKAAPVGALAGEAGSSGVQATTQQRNPLGQELVDWCAARTVAEITTKLWKHDVPNAAVASTPQVVEDPHLWAREMLVKVPDAVAGELFVPGLSIKFSKTPGHIGLVPTLGQHTDEVLTSWLDYDADRIGALRASGAIG
jgi:crotonobetainyl-CoA:carnitine CoA-transferase CaiB-like acyl-CoA transferase